MPFTYFCFCFLPGVARLKFLKVIAFTHKQVELKELGKFVICDQTFEARLQSVKDRFNIPELFYLGTCNRVEFVFVSNEEISPDFTRQFIEALNFDLDASQLERLMEHANVYEDTDALNHLLRMSCSLESLVVGEKEILAQVRKAYETARQHGFTGDYLRMIMNRVVKTAKEVYTHTNISRNPISVVSLAYRKLRELNTCANARILIVGAGETNTTISKYLKKHKYSNFTVFNRTLSKAKKLADDLGGQAYSLDHLKDYKEGFDVLITCTGAPEAIITPNVYYSLLNGETDRKVIVDLAVPNDVAAEVDVEFPVSYIEVESLQVVASANMQERCQELCHAERIIDQNIEEFIPLLKQRRVELAMSKVPETIKEIRHKAIYSVFADDINSLDANSREVLEKVINYMEKKYISVPMIMAKEILVKNN